VTAGYRLADGVPGPTDYCRLRETAGLSPKTAAQAEAVVPGTWYACHVVHEDTGEVVAMGRVIGDGSWYFHIADMATSPDHQRRGLGRLVLDRLVDEIRARAVDTPYVTLFADAPGRPLYARAGFVDAMPHSMGMRLESDWSL
jgi:GNAT superfamily N-acetyltransferase